MDFWTQIGKILILIGLGSVVQSAANNPNPTPGQERLKMAFEDIATEVEVQQQYAEMTREAEHIADLQEAYSRKWGDKFLTILVKKAELDLKQGKISMHKPKQLKPSLSRIIP